MKRTGCLNLLSILLFINLIFFPVQIKAQVTIGSGIEPQRGALLDMKQLLATPATNDTTSWRNSDKGLLIPKVMLVSYDDLAPLYADPEATATEKLFAAGMIVYNVNPAAFDLKVGLYVWNSEKWLPLVANAGTGIAVIDPMDCTIIGNITAGGQYTTGQSLNPNENILSVPVHVSKRGTYSMAAFPQNGNGYYFSISDEFLLEGDYIVVLRGSGTPLTDRTDYIDLYINGEKVSYAGCPNTPTVTVNTDRPQFDLVCTGITVPTGLEAGTAISPTETISLNINSSVTSPNPFVIETDEVNGVKFTATGNLVPSTQSVQLVAEGLPQQGGTYTYTITTNSYNSAQQCQVDITYIAQVERTINVAVYSQTGGVDRDLLNPSNKSVRSLLANTANFGPDTDSKVRVQSINIISGGSDLTNLSDVITNQQADIILINYNVIPSTTELATLVTYVNNGGVVVYCSDHTDDTRKTRIKQMIDGIFGSDVEVSSYYTGSSYPFVGTSIVVTGPFLDLRGQYLGHDSGWNCDITNASLPPVAEILVNGTNGVRSFMHPSKGFIFVGDGGPFAGNDVSASGENYPCRHSGGLPVLHPNYSPNVANSYFFCNIIAWGVRYAVTQRSLGGAVQID